VKKITIISIILVLILIGPLASQGIIFEDDFESYTVGTFPSSNWNLKYSGSGTENQIIVNDQYVSPTQSLKLECAPNWAGTADVQLSYTPSIVYCEGYVKAEHEFGGPDFGFQNPDIGPWGTVYANVGVCKDGNIICNNQVLQTSEANRWYHIKIKYNSCLDLCDVWIDGVLKGKDIACSTNGEYTILRLSTHNSSASTKGWYDDIKVYYSSGWNREGYDLGWSFFNPNATQTPIQNFLLGVDWSTNIENPNVLEGDNIDILTGDVNGDGFPELVYTSNNIIHVLDGNGNELWSTDSGLVDECHHNALEDVTGDGIPEIIIGAKISSTLKLLFYDGYGNLIKEITETEQVSQYDYIKARAVQDIDNDGDLEVIFWRLWGFEPWSRGIGVFDYNSGHREWFFPIGPNIWTLCVADVTGDSNMEILTGTIGPCNGHSANGFSDCSCYAICWDKDGNLIWSQQFEGSGFVDTKVSINDLDGDGKNEVIYTSFEHGWETWDGDLGRIYLLNPDNGEIMKEYNAGMPIRVNGVADITGNDNKEILVTCSNGATQTGKIIMFDNSLNLLNEYSIQGTTLGICAINDLNGDDELEIIVRKLLYDEFAVLDDSLNELWSVQYDDDILNVIPTDLNNDGINELIVSTENTLQVLEFKFMPSFAIDLNDQVACKNDSIAFEVIVEGSLPIDYQWQKDNINIPGAMESTLILPDVQAEDAMIMEAIPVTLPCLQLNLPFQQILQVLPMSSNTRLYSILWLSRKGIPMNSWLKVETRSM
jgi:small nuclear ribonucleoprotein (snRNP)-like protein